MLKFTRGHVSKFLTLCFVTLCFQNSAALADDICALVENCNEMRSEILEAGSRYATDNTAFDRLGPWTLIYRDSSNRGDLVMSPPSVFEISNRGNGRYTVYLINYTALFDTRYGARTMLPITLHLGDEASNTVRSESSCRIQVRIQTNAHDAINPLNIPENERTINITPENAARIINITSLGIEVERLAGFEQIPVTVQLVARGLENIPPTSIAQCPVNSGAPAPVSTTTVPEVPVTNLTRTTPEPAPAPASTTAPASVPSPAVATPLPAAPNYRLQPNAFAAAGTNYPRSITLGGGLGGNNMAFAVRGQGQGIFRSGPLNGSVIEGGLEIGFTNVAFRVNGRTEIYPMRILRRDLRNGRVTFELVFTPGTARAQFDLGSDTPRGHMVITPQLAAALGIEEGRFRGVLRLRV